MWDMLILPTYIIHVNIMRLLRQQLCSESVWQCLLNHNNSSMNDSWAVAIGATMWKEYWPTEWSDHSYIQKHRLWTNLNLPASDNYLQNCIPAVYRQHWHPAHPNGHHRQSSRSHRGKSLQCLQLQSIHPPTLAHRLCRLVGLSMIDRRSTDMNG